LIHSDRSDATIDCRLVVCPTYLFLLPTVEVELGEICLPGGAEVKVDITQFEGMELGKLSDAQEISKGQPRTSSSKRINSCLRLSAALATREERCSTSWQCKSSIFDSTAATPVTTGARSILVPAAAMS
jgi:hypothetical protein